MYGLLIEGAIQFIKKTYGDETLDKALKKANLDINS